MERIIFLEDKKIKYRYRRLRRARSVTITVKPDASVLVTTPYFFSIVFMEKAIREQAKWILKKINHYSNSPSFFRHLSHDHYQKYKTAAQKFILQKTKEINRVYNFSYRRVSVRNQSTLWGSCSQSKNLSFNYKLYFLPVHLSEYIIAHELCHLQELNHSKKFWQLVELAIPDYQYRRRQLKKIE